MRVLIVVMIRIVFFRLLLLSTAFLQHSWKFTIGHQGGKWWARKEKTKVLTIWPSNFSHCKCFSTRINKTTHGVMGSNYFTPLPFQGWCPKWSQVKFCTHMDAHGAHGTKNSHPCIHYNSDKKIRNKYMFFFKNPYLMNHTLNRNYFLQEIHTHASTIIPALIKNKKIRNKYMFFFKNPYLMNHTLNRNYFLQVALAQTPGVPWHHHRYLATDHSQLISDVQTILAQSDYRH